MGKRSNGADQCCLETIGIRQLSAEISLGLRSPVTVRAGEVHGGKRNGQVKDSIILQLVNTEKNRALLKTCPSRLFLDLSIIYKIQMCKGNTKVAQAMVDNSMAEALGMDEEALYQAAIKNTRELLPPVVASLKGMVDELCAQESVALPPLELGQKELSMYVLTNDAGIGGAAVLLYTEELDGLARKLGEDIYILPSSRHEVIAVPAYEGTLDYLKQIVFDVNRTEVHPEDRLSDQVYYYNRDEQTVVIAEKE